LSFTPKCRARVPSHKLRRPKLTSSSHGFLLFLKICLFLFVQFVYNPCITSRYTTGYLRYFFFLLSYISSSILNL
jgi:hypothetical protein